MEHILYDLFSYGKVAFSILPVYFNNPFFSISTNLYTNPIGFIYLYVLNYVPIPKASKECYVFFNYYKNSIPISFVAIIYIFYDIL